MFQCVCLEFLNCVYCLYCCLKYKGQYGTIITGFHLNLYYVAGTEIYRLWRIDFCKMQQTFLRFIITWKKVFKGKYISSCCSLFVTEFLQVKHKKLIRGFPGGAVVGSPPANAGDMGSGPGPGGSHMPWSGWACAPQLLSLCSRAREPQLLKSAHLEPVLRSGVGRRSERPVHRGEGWPPLAAAGEGPRSAAGTQRSQK